MRNSRTLKTSPLDTKPRTLTYRAASFLDSTIHLLAPGAQNIQGPCAPPGAPGGLPSSLPADYPPPRYRNSLITQDLMPIWGISGNGKLLNHRTRQPLNLCASQPSTLHHELWVVGLKPEISGKVAISLCNAHNQTFSKALKPKLPIRNPRHSRRLAVLCHPLLGLSVRRRRHPTSLIIRSSGAHRICSLLPERGTLPGARFFTRSRPRHPRYIWFSGRVSNRKGASISLGD